MDREVRLKKSRLILDYIFSTFIFTFILALFTCFPQIAAADSKSNENQVKPIKIEPPVTVIEKLNDAAGNSPDLKKAAMVNIELGLGYLDQGQVARAKSKFIHALKLAPNISETHTAMAHFLERIGDSKEAEKEHKKAIRFVGNGSNSGGAVHNNYGAFLCRQNRMKEADNEFQRALLDKSYTRTAEVNENAGICAVKAQNKAAAIRYLWTAIQQDAKRSSATLELAYINFEENELKEAKRLMNQYRMNADPSPRSLWLGIQLSHRLNDKEGVASQAQLLKSLFENSPEYQLFLDSEIPKPS